MRVFHNSFELSVLINSSFQVGSRLFTKYFTDQTSKILDTMVKKMEEHPKNDIHLGGDLISLHVVGKG